MLRSLLGCLALTHAAGSPHSQTASDRRGEMASSSGALADCPRLVDKKDAKSELSQRKAHHHMETRLQIVFQSDSDKGGNMSNMAKHLSDRHHKLFKEFKERQVNKCEHLQAHPYTA